MAGGDDIDAAQHFSLMTELRGRFDDVVIGSNTTRCRRRRLHNANDDASASIVSTSHLSGTADNETRNVDGSRREQLDAFLGHVISDTMDLSAGDQIYVYRGIIQHHGIVVSVLPSEVVRELLPGEEGLAVKVVHFDAKCNGIETTTLAGFTKGATLRRARYSAPMSSWALHYGASYSCAADDPAMIVHRATAAARHGEGVSGWSGYSLLTNNCETFACWCSTGRRGTLSRQAARGLVGAGVIAAGVYAVAAAGTLNSAVRIAAGSRKFNAIRKTYKAVQWTAGAATLAITLADVIGSVAKPKQTPESDPRANTSANAVQPDVKAHVQARAQC